MGNEYKIAEITTPTTLHVHFSRQVKQGIWPKIFNMCVHGNLPPTQENFEDLKIKGCTRVVVGYSYNLCLLKNILSRGTTE